jgi:hypothetical protein
MRAQLRVVSINNELLKVNRGLDASVGRRMGEAATAVTGRSGAEHPPIGRQRVSGGHAQSFCASLPAIAQIFCRGYFSGPYIPAC